MTQPTLAAVCPKRKYPASKAVIQEREGEERRLAPPVRHRNIEAAPRPKY
jgi:hypothetical protein